MGGLEWWEPAKEKDEHTVKSRAKSLVETVKALENSQRGAHEQNLWNARLYSNRELAHFDWGHGVFYNTSLSPVSLLGENLCLSIVDTLVARIGKQRAKVTVQPVGASFKVQKQCRRLDKWLWGEFQRLKVYHLTTQVFRDACVFGFGVLKVDVDEDGKVRVRRVFPDDFIVDQMEFVNGDGARHAYERKCRRIDEVEAEYGLEPGTVQGEAQGYLDYRQPGRGHCIVVEGYRTATEHEQGRHYIAVDGIELLDEPWEHKWLPYVWYHYNDPLSGFYYPSVVEQVTPFQIRLNEINEVIRDAQDLMARPRIFVAEGSRVTGMDLDNKVGRVIKYTGVMPEAVTWSANNPELLNERERLIKATYEQFGIMPMAAQGKLPNQARLDSSAALQEAITIGDDRQADAMQRFEDFHLELARLMIRVMGAMGGVGGTGGETVWFSGGRRSRAETIKWSEIDLDDNGYTMSLGAASVFTMTPAARTDKIEGWMAKGLISQEQYWQLIDSPDLETEISLQDAARDDIKRVIELLEDGKYESPQPYQDLINGVEMVSKALLRLKDYEDVEPEVPENMIKWVAMAREVLRQGTQTPDQEGAGSLEMGPAGEPLPPGQGGPGGPMNFTAAPPMPMPGMAPMAPGMM